jgi:hypothetical protein
MKRTRKRASEAKLDRLRDWRRSPHWTLDPAEERRRVDLIDGMIDLRISQADLARAITEDGGRTFPPSYLHRYLSGRLPVPTAVLAYVQIARRVERVKRFASGD